MRNYKEIKTDSGKTLRRVSRWIQIQTAYNVTPRHSLYYYADKDGDGNTLFYFRYNGRKWALGQFFAFGTMFTPTPPETWKEHDKLHYISGYDSENYYNPILIEINEYGERVRVCEEV